MAKQLGKKTGRSSKKLELKDTPADNFQLLDELVQLGRLLGEGIGRNSQFANLRNESRVVGKDPLDSLRALAAWGIQLGVSDQVGR